MNLFRSEEHAKRWAGDRGGGTTISVTQLSELAEAWYRDRLVPDWRPRSAEESQAILDRLGLDGPFWRLRG